MKIAMMVRAYLTTPVPHDITYSPAVIAASIAEGLAAKGHDVTLFGPEGSQLNGPKIETCHLRPLATSSQQLQDMIAATDLFKDYIPSLYDQFMARTMFERAAAGEFDVLMFHHPESAMGYAPLYPDVPVVYILHDYLDEDRRQLFEIHHSPNQHFISISDSQRRDSPDLPYLATVHNGIDTSVFSYDDKAENYLLYAGRIIPEKGVREAIQVAIKSGLRLIITGQLLPLHQWYFDQHIKPYLSDKILYLGLIDKDQLAKYYQKAAALLMPIRWEEPFGLAMVEAMACGTPVIAFRRGSVPEIIIDGKTGYIVDSTAEMADAVNKLDKLNRSDCHHHVMQNFTVGHMITSYDHVLQQLIKTTPPLKTSIVKEMKRMSGKIIDQLR